MKEIIVIEDRNLVNHYKNSFDSKAKLVSIPETFEELKELFKDMFVEVNEHSIIVFGCLEFWEDGTLSFFHSSDIAENLTPAQMYQIIKNLIGE